MKQLEMLGLALLTVLLLAALGGAPSAMAEAEPTELCKADETTCKTENAITTVHEVTPELKRAALLTSSGNVECNVLFKGEIPDEATNGPAFVSGNFTYTGCLFKGAGCEVKEVSKSSLLTIIKEGAETGSVKASGEFSVKCGLSISCTFVEENLLGAAKGALSSTLENGELSFKEAAIKKTTGTLCPKESKLDMTTTPSAVKTFLSTGNMYCVIYENSRGRWELKISSTACTLFKGIQTYNYEMVTSRVAGLTTGAMLCVRDEGLTQYLTRNGKTCETKDKEPEGKYELATVS